MKLTSSRSHRSFLFPLQFPKEYSESRFHTLTQAISYFLVSQGPRYQKLRSDCDYGLLMSMMLIPFSEAITEGRLLYGNEIDII